MCQLRRDGCQRLASGDAAAAGTPIRCHASETFRRERYRKMENLIVALIVGLALFFTFRHVVKLITAKGNCGCGCSCEGCADESQCGPVDKFFHTTEDSDCRKPSCP